MQTSRDHNKPEQGAESGSYLRAILSEREIFQFVKHRPPLLLRLIYDRSAPACLFMFQADSDFFYLLIN